MKKRLHRILLLVIAFSTCFAHGQSSLPGAGQTTLSTKEAGISRQERKEYEFLNGSLRFGNRFDGARLNAVKQTGPTDFLLEILPENKPVNPSPWYAFSLWSNGIKTVSLTLRYPSEKHRYPPRISIDGRQWQSAGPVVFNADSSEARFALALDSGKVLIAAQELVSAADTYAWIDSLARLPFVQKQTIGNSVWGNPIVALQTLGSEGKKLVVVLSRQHPPEVTGYMAMQAFVQTLLANTPQAYAFRKEYQLVVVPMLNPDGVDEGNWRHNAGGVDLNRDWELFRQPETRAVKEFLLSKVQQQGARIYFGVDFHSTFSDVFYTNPDSVNTNVPGLTTRWISAFERAIPGFVAKVKPSGNGGNVSKSWLSQELCAEALTYEVGDQTSREMLQLKGRVAAEKLMELLLVQ